ncbi:FtsH protease activity modulator HflK [bacterium]|jgi:membrane protease subunit HflK|nr:FtsH protease activity modulator HflK [bacterium]MBT3795367.1 FtsH protease activity modulator HflK [bacterium]MBT4634249.1 FtsH protease activity modulator HflK [bacterium]
MFRLIKLIVEFLNNLDRRGTTNGSIPTINPDDKKNIKKLFIIVPIFLGVLAVLSSIYTIEPGEVGVVQRFGKFSSYKSPGLNLKIPLIDKLTKVNVEKVRRIEIGFRSERARVNVLQESLMITKDENIVSAQAIIQWKIKDPGNYLFKVVNPMLTIKNTAEVALRSTVGVTNIDDALTTGRDQIQVKTKEFLQILLDSYSSGVQITDVKLQIVDPPDEVKDAFNEVVRAKEDKERLINEAKGYYEDVIPKARGEAEKMIKEAEGYREQRISTAMGDTSRFNQVYSEYRKDKAVTKSRIYLEKLSEILQKPKKVIGTDSSSGALNLLQLGDIFKD